ncbi:trichothecene 3-O-acetyltransferase [Thozetella sp. PMI_491]|nr:trichothecene 3-O-acetyltransferase [Thozetella sp. PMI_491]
MTTSSSPAMDMDIELDPLGQIPVKIYTQISLIYPLSSTSSDAEIASILTAGLERLSEGFPWVAGQVVREGASGSNSGVAKIKPFRKAPQLVVKNARDDPKAPSLAAMRDGGFPIRLLDEELVAPRSTVPLGDQPAEEPSFYFQATFIAGGLILTSVAHHSTMDIVGQAFVTEMLSKACRGESFTSDELKVGNLRSADIIPLLEGYTPGPEVAHQIVKPAPMPSESTEVLAPPPSPPCRWANFNFDALALAALKAKANKTVPKGFVSTDDALTALIWQSVTRARIPRFQESHPSNVKFARAVDARAALGIEARYPGWIQNMTYHHYPPHKLVDDPLGVVAADFRAALDPKDLRFRTQALATLLHNTPDKTKTNLTASIDLENDIMLSSWSKMDFYSKMDFNLGLGNPEAVRRPQFFPVESLIYLGAKAPNGQIVAAVCLRDEDMDRLKADPEFTAYGTYVG